jgi:hypothetical protein
MQQDLKAELLTIVQAVAFPSPGSVTLAGRAMPNPAPGGMPGLAAPGNPLVSQLLHLLYDGCYCRRFGTPLPQWTNPPAPNPAFLEALSAANTGREHWDAGWQIQQSYQSGQIAAVKGAMTRLVWPGEFHSHGAPGVAPQPGTQISLFAPRESRTSQPGFYYAFGEALADQQDDFGILRFYWNVTADGAAALIRNLTQALNRFAIPFRFKCLQLPELFDRTDAAVLYIAKRHYRVAASILPDVHRAIRPSLEPATPLFAKTLADGLGFAEDPKTGESFGMSRCRLVAEAVCRAHEQGAHSAEARLERVIAAFAAARLSLDAPYLNAGSTDRYAFEMERAA